MGMLAWTRAFCDNRLLVFNIKVQRQARWASRCDFCRDKALPKPAAGIELHKHLQTARISVEERDHFTTNR